MKALVFQGPGKRPSIQPPSDAAVRISKTTISGAAYRNLLEKERLCPGSRKP
jgi:hypothetical protein